MGFALVDLYSYAVFCSGWRHQRDWGKIGGMKPIFYLYLFVVLLRVAPVSGQDESTRRDPPALAARYLNYEGESAPGVLAAGYAPGDRTRFRVSKRGQTAPVQIDAVLMAAEPYKIYLWIEQGIPYDAAAMRAFAAEMGNTLDQLRQRTRYAARDYLNDYLNAPDPIFDPTNLLPLPDVDGDAHLHILFAPDLFNAQTASYHPNDSLPAALTPGGFSNEREVIYVNLATLPPGTPFDDPAFAAAIARTMLQLLLAHNAPEQALWLREALSIYATTVAAQVRLSAQNIGRYFADPDLPLLLPLSAGGAVAARVGGEQLWLEYFRQRYGDDALRALFRTEGAGVAALDRVLSQHAIIDPLSGAPVTARAAFTDFLLANALNRPLGDGRFAYTAVTLPPNLPGETLNLAQAVRLDDQSVNPFGAYVLRLRQSVPGNVEIRFDGQPEAARLPMPGGLDNQFYWSGDQRDRDHTLTRAVDLTGVETAVLTFDAWYVLASGWDYGYIAVSEDDGATWTALPATNTTDINPYGAAYGAGFTSQSRPPDAAAPRWLPQRVDLTPYAGKRILLRFEYISLPHVASAGFAVDNIAVEEIGFFDDAAAESDWERVGWQRIDNHTPAQFAVLAATTGTTTHPPFVRTLIAPDEGLFSGAWSLFFEPNETLILIVTALDDGAYALAGFDVEIVP